MNANLYICRKHRSARRVSDPAETSDRRSPEVLETFGPWSGSVGRPSHRRGDRATAAASCLHLFCSVRLCLGCPPTSMPYAVWMAQSANSSAAWTTELSRKTSLSFGTCSVCHLARSGGPRNEYGNAINTLLRLSECARILYGNGRRGGG